MVRSRSATPTSLGQVEQVENHSDEPKVTPRRAATPPAALFLPPPVPEQADNEDRDEPAPAARNAAAKRNPDFTPPKMPPPAPDADPLLLDEPKPDTQRKPDAQRKPETRPKRTPEARPKPVAEVTVEPGNRSDDAAPQPIPAQKIKPSAVKATPPRPEPETRARAELKTKAEPKTKETQTEKIKSDTPSENPGGTRTRAADLTTLDLWTSVKAEPRRAPAAAALAAVRQLGRGAQQQADWLRTTYPSVDVERLAKIAHQNALARTRWAILASVPLLGTAGVAAYSTVQARLVLELAAIFGHEATDPRRAAEVLVLLGVYQDLYDADAAIEAVLDDQRAVPLVPALGHAGLTGHVVRRFAGKFLPGAGLVLDGLASVTAIEELSARATRFYRDRVLVER